MKFHQQRSRRYGNHATQLSWFIIWYSIMNKKHRLYAYNVHLNQSNAH